jgi:hypothetical protein
MYAVVGFDFIASYLMKTGENVADAMGRTWHSGDIFETSALTTLLTMMFVVVLATVKVLREPDETQLAP